MRAAVGWILLVLGGCFFGELTVIEGEPGTGGGGGSGEGGEEPAAPCDELLTAPYWGPDCAACIEAECCAEADACLADEACVAFRDCIEDDMGPHSARRCGHDVPYGTDRWAPVGKCFFDRCRSACFSERWHCVDGYEWPPKVSQKGLVQLHVRVLPEDIKPDLSAKACDGLSVNCDPPIAETVSSPGTGNVYLDVPLTFNGYFELLGDGIFPTRVYPWPMWQGFLVNPASPSIDTFNAIANSLGDPLDPAMGRVFLIAHDCFDVAASGVSFELDSSAIVEPPPVYYLQGLIPLTGQTATTADGIAVWTNVPPGTVTYVGKDEATGEVVTLGSILVSAGWQTFAWAHPKAMR